MLRQLNKLIIRVGHWEYWNANIIYIPILPYLLYLFVRARNCFFFNAANPGIEYGGFLMESKWRIYSDAPRGFFPETMFIAKKDSFEHVARKAMNNFGFPFIAKPDTGSKGRGVMLINSVEELKAYHVSCPVNYIIQEKIDYPLEAGIFYVRYPNSDKGIITGIVEKKYIKVVGDGFATIEQLLLQNKRYVLQIDALEKILTAEELNTLLPLGEEHTVLEIGNHARGSLFLDVSSKINEELNAIVDTICRQFHGFYFGRLDIRFESWEDLMKGINYSIIELNGSGSEPTHIYAPSHSIFYAWKEICRHWKYMQEISSQNNKKGVQYLSFKQAYQMFKDNIKTNRLLSAFEPLRQQKKRAFENEYEQLQAVG